MEEARNIEIIARIACKSAYNSYTDKEKSKYSRMKKWETTSECTQTRYRKIGRALIQHFRPPKDIKWPEPLPEYISNEQRPSIEELEKILKYKSCELLPDGRVRDNEAVKINKMLDQCKAAYRSKETKWPEELISTLEHARIFLTTREKMHKTGIELYDQMLALCKEAHPVKEIVWPEERENIQDMNDRDMLDNKEINGFNEGIAKCKEAERKSKL